MFTIPSQVLTVTDKPKEEKPDENNQNLNTTIVIAGNLSAIMRDALNQELKIDDSVVEQKEENINVNTESLVIKENRKFFIYANTSVDLEEEPLPISLDIGNLLKHFKVIGFQCFVILDNEKLPKTFKNSAALEEHVNKLNIKSYLNYHVGFSHVLRTITGR